VRNSTIPVKTIVIDNASTDDTVSYIKTNFPEIHLIESEENLGFGKANNIGMRNAMEKNADYVFLLNQDAYIEQDAIEKLVYASVLNPEYAILSPLQMNGSKSGFDNGFAICVKDLWDFNTYSSIKKEITEKIYPVKFVMAAMWLLPCVYVKKTGGFNPVFQHYGEDNDYVNRIHYHGYKIGVCSSSIGYHDRDVRMVDKEEKLERHYVLYLFISTNINKTLIFSIMHCVLLIFMQLIKSILLLDLMSTKFFFKCIFRSDSGRKKINVLFKFDMYARTECFPYRAKVQVKECQ
jgi:GT2 family glycosyltransferase